MAKKRRKSRATSDEKKLKIKDPDPNSEEFIYDEVEKFHRTKDKILLDPTQVDEESELEESENEEVLALPDSDDSDIEMDDEDDEEEDQSSSDDENDLDDDGLPSDKAWGKNKKAFYDADVQDEDIEASDEEAEMAAAEEEKEAMMLQKRMTEKLDKNDFFAVADDDEIDEEEDDDEEKKKDTAIIKDLSKLSKREKLEILAKQSPELLPLLDEFKEKLAEVKDKYQPLMELVKQDVIKSKQGVVYVQTKYQLLLNYLINVSFYFFLKSQKENVSGHPVINVLVKYKQLLAQMEPLDERMNIEIVDLLTNVDINEGKYMTDVKKRKAADESDTDQLMDLLRKKTDSKKSKKKKMVNNEQPDQEEEVIDPLEYYNKIKEQKELRNLKDTEESGDIDNDDDVDYDDLDEDGKRRITYEMSKNKGLIRKRRKELKNPRVKHKMKFKKAKIKHKSQVREVQRETVRYGGEMTGIKSTLSRSVKIK